MDISHRAVYSHCKGMCMQRTLWPACMEQNTLHKSFFFFFFPGLFLERQNIFNLYLDSMKKYLKYQWVDIM